MQPPPPFNLANSLSILNKRKTVNDEEKKKNAAELRENTREKRRRIQESQTHRQPGSRVGDILQSGNYLRLFLLEFNKNNNENDDYHIN